MKIKCLVENTSCDEDKFCAQHGISFLIFTKNKKILFDLGQNDLFMKNALLMHESLDDVDCVVISHGHYDHGGGLEYFIDKHPEVPVYIHKQAFESHYNGKEKYIGLNNSLIEKGNFIFTGNSFSIDENIRLESFNDEKRSFPFGSFGLNLKTESGEFLPDDFSHEQYLIAEENGKRIVISGCSHKGILNIVKWTKPDVLIGGFHFKKLDTENQSDRDYMISCGEMLKNSDCRYYTCHCTGEKQFELLKGVMGDRLSYIRAGDEIEI